MKAITDPSTCGLWESSFMSGLCSHVLYFGFLSKTSHMDEGRMVHERVYANNTHCMGRIFYSIIEPVLSTM